MQVQSTNSYSSPNFGIRYELPQYWKPEVLDALMNSNLVKYVDEVFPKAVVSMKHPYNPYSKGYTLQFKLNEKYSTYIKTNSYKTTDKLVKKIKDTKVEDFAKQIEKDIFEQDRVRNIYKAAEESNRKNETGFFERIVNLFF